MKKLSNWHSRPLGELMGELGSSPQGLSGEEARGRLRKNGGNELEQPPRPSIFRRIFAQLKDPMIVVLLVAAVLSLLASGGEDWLDGAIILLIVVVNGFISISQEDNAHRALEALQEMTAPTTNALRDGKRTKLEAKYLVPGDVVLLVAGNLIPADCRLISATGLSCDESAMTGESVPVEKYLGADALPADTPLGDRHNMLLSGTVITAGKCTALVVATGMDTEMGKIAQLLLEGDEQETPLQIKMAEVSKMLSLICLGVCAVMFGVGLIQGKDLLEMFLTAVSLAVAAIPEGLPAIVTIVLALGVGRMANRGAIVKKLPAVETLGCASVICSDKTGTLTQNKMTVTDIWLPPEGSREELITAALLCNDAALHWERGLPTATGNPTEGALLVYGAKEGIFQEKLLETRPRRGEIPFDSTRKRMSTLHPNQNGGGDIYVKGAPDILLNLCSATPAGELTAAQRQRIGAANSAMAQRGLRVIGVASRRLNILPKSISGEILEENLVFLGLFGLSDPPRLEVAEAVLDCHGAGIRPVMITGDHKETALAIAKSLQIYRPEDLVVTGSELDFMTQNLLEEEIHRISVFARVSPEHKMRIVKAWQARGQVVAMSGDGINDAPALRAADIGCAMGLSGTDVAKGASEMILTDDNFATIVEAVEEGRGIYQNIAKAIHYLLSCNIGEIITIFVATLFNFSQMPLVPVQLLWLNLVTDALPALALGMEPVERDVMSRPPRDPQENLFNQKFSLRLLWQGCMVGGLTLSAYLFGVQSGGGEIACTMAFATLTLSQLVHAFNVRSECHSLGEIGVFTNPAMNRALLVGLILQFSVLLLPPVMPVFSVVPLAMNQWLVVGALALLPVPICEVEKRLGRPEERAANINVKIPAGKG